MKKRFLGFATIIGLSVALFSCSDKDKDETDGTDPGEITEYPLSTETPEKIREYVAAKGETLINSLQGFDDESAIKALIAFGHLSQYLDGISAENDAEKSAGFRKISEKDPESLTQLYGTYTWDLSKGEWTFDSAVKDKAVFIYPMDATAKTNNARIEASAASSGVVADDQDIPKNITINIYVDNKKVGDMSMAATNINETTLADAANVAFNLGKYVLTGDVTKKGTANEATFKFTASGNTLMLVKADLAADVTAKMLRDEDYSSMKDGNFSAILGEDLSIVGYLDGAKYTAAMKAIAIEEDALDIKYWGDWETGEEGLIYANGEYNHEARQEYEVKFKDLEVKKVEALNSNLNVILASIGQEKKLANVIIEAEVEEEDNPWNDMIYYYVNSKFVFEFNDGVTADADTYFSKGFDKVLNAINDLLAKYN